MPMKNSFKLIKLVVLLYRVCKFVTFSYPFWIYAHRKSTYAPDFSCQIKASLLAHRKGVDFVAFSEYMNFKISEMYDVIIKPQSFHHLVYSLIKLFIITLRF